MIKNGVLTIQSRENPLLFWRPESDALTNILLGLIITIISYQVTAIIVDLVFGLKPPGVSKVSDVMLFQLMYRSSPTFLRPQFRPQKGAMNTSQTPTYRHPIRFKLLLVAIVAPIINIAAIFPSLKINTFLTFSEAGLGGLSYGLNPRSKAENLSYEPFGGCRKARTDFGTYRSSLVNFFHCCEVHIKKSEQRGTANVTIILSNYSRLIAGAVFVPGTTLSMLSSLKIIPIQDAPPNKVFKKQIVLVRRIDQNDFDTLMDEVVKVLINFCGSNDVVANHHTEKGTLSATRTVSCNSSDKDGKILELLEQIRKLICSRISFVNSDVMGAVDGRNKTVILDDVLLLKSTRSIASPLILLLVMFFMVTVRATVKQYTRNDLSKGLGLVIREALQLPCCDSMLCRKDVMLRYGEDQLK